MSDSVSIEAAQEELTERLLPLAGVQGLGLGECEGAPCIVVLIAERTDELRSRIPESWRGHPVEARIIGEVTPRGD